MTDFSRCSWTGKLIAECGCKVHASRATRALLWARECFGGAAMNPQSRGYRLLEEAIELAQALGCERAEAHALVDRTFDRPPGELAQEMAQVQLTLDVLAELTESDLAALAEAELARVKTFPVSYWRDRHREKIGQGEIA